MQVAEVPEGLAAIAVGPELAAALDALAPAQIPNDRILDVVAAHYRQLSHNQARMAAFLAELGHCPGHTTPGQVVRSPAPDRYAPDETRAALNWTRRAADVEHNLAETVVHTMPAVFAAWLAGLIDRPRVQVFEQYLTGLTAEQIERICQIAVPRAPKLTTGQLAHLLRRMVIAVDPDAAARWYRKGIRERNVTAYPAPDGTITLSANGLPTDQAEAACERIQQLAAAAKRAGHPGLIGQIRCDLFLGLLDGRFHTLTTDQVIATLIRDYRPAGPTGGSAQTPAADSPATTDPARSRPALNDRDDGGSHDGDLVSVDADDSSPDARDPDHGRPDAGDAGDNGPLDNTCGNTGQDGSGPHAGGSGGPGGRTPPTGPAGNPADQRVGIEIRIGLATLLGLDEHPAEIPGLGLLIAPDARFRVALQGRAEWRFAVTDTDGTLLSEGRTRRRPTGVRREGPHGGIVEIHVPTALLDELIADSARCGRWDEVVEDIATQHADRERHLADLDAHRDARLPGAALRRHTEIRDRTCTFAGVCRRPARAAEMDHSRDHARGGTTERINIGPLCDHDHDVKHRAGWTVTQPEPGTFVWRSPLGGHYTARGEFLLPELPEPAPDEPDPWLERTPRSSRARSCSAHHRPSLPHRRLLPRPSNTPTSHHSDQDLTNPWRRCLNKATAAEGRSDAALLVRR